MHPSGESCSVEVVLPIWKIEKRGLSNEAREESVNGPESPHDLVQNE